MTLRRASSPNMDWSLASFMTSAVILTISEPPNSLRAVPHPRVPDTSTRVQIMSSQKKTKVLSPESNTGSANYVLAVLSI